MKTVKKKRVNYKFMTDDHRALRELRLSQERTLTEASALLGLKSKALGHIENGRTQLSEERIKQIVQAYGLHFHDFVRTKKTLHALEKNRPRRQFTRGVLTNKDRRSYQRIVTKEVRVLKTLRKIKGLTQDVVSSMCGYSAPTIGHIENGRIEIPRERVEHIVRSMGYELRDFDRVMLEELLRDEVIEACMKKLMVLSEDKLRLCSSLLQSM